MFTSFKGRSVFHGQKVRVYRNLHKYGIVYSVQDPKTGLVLGYSEAVLLEDAKFIVSQAGLLRVLLTKKKNVHAFVEGTFSFDLDFVDYMRMEKVSYNPYKHTSFVREDGTKVSTAKTVLINAHGVQAFQPA